MSDWLRTIAFSIVFYGLSVPYVLGAPLIALFGRPRLIAYTVSWERLFRWSTHHILGIRRRYEGTKATSPVLYVAKHQALYETFELTLELDNPGTVMKQELAQIPIWGWAAKRYGVIVVDRAASATALRQMGRDAKAALAEGRSILIFAEGTRVRPGEQPPLRSGFAGLYRMLGLPVVPIALDSAHVWPRNGPKRPGTVTFRFGEAIPPGLPRVEVEARVHAAINSIDTEQSLRVG